MKSEYVIERSWDGGPWIAVAGGSEGLARATMAQCAPRWRKQGYSVRLVSA